MKLQCVDGKKYKNYVISEKKMDYSTLKTIKSQRDPVAEGIDLSSNYANASIDEQQDKLHSMKFINKINNNNCTSGGGSDVDDEVMLTNQPSISPPASPSPILQPPEPPSTTQRDTRVKLNFSVDRILSRETNSDSNDSKFVNGSGCHNNASLGYRNSNNGYNSHHHNSNNCNHRINNNCLECTNGNGVMLPVHPQSMFSVPFSVSAMLNLNKSVIRPMPVRYLSRSPTGNYICLL